MATTKPRIFITLPRLRFTYLKKLAEEREESLSRTASQLVETGLETLEDEWLSEIADQRLKNFDMKKAISFEQVKRRFGQKPHRRAR